MALNLAGQVMLHMTLTVIYDGDDVDGDLVLTDLAEDLRLEMNSIIASMDNVVYADPVIDLFTEVTVIPETS